MTPSRLVYLLQVMRMTHRKLAVTVHVSTRTVTRWVAGEWPIPDVIAKLLNLMHDTKTRPEELYTGNIKPLPEDIPRLPRRRPRRLPRSLKLLETQTETQTQTESTEQ
jgi:hypothetical protein